MIKINLLAARKPTAKASPSARPKLEIGGGQNLLLIGVLLLGAAVAGGWWWSLSSQEATLRRNHAEADRELARLAEVRKKADEYKKKKDTLVRQIELITRLKKQQDVPVHILDQISRNLPDAVWLESMSVANNQISVGGKATNYHAVTNFYNNLAHSGHFAGVTLGRVFEVKEGVSFSLNCGFAGLGSAPAAAAPPAPPADASAERPQQG